MNKPFERPNSENRIVLSVSPLQEDHTVLRETLKGWAATIYTADCASSAQHALLRKDRISVVLCERDLAPGNWIDVLQLLLPVHDAPPLIVTSRLADEALWAEALNFGAYDVLGKPFDRQELLRAVHLAWFHWRHRNDAGPAARKRQVDDRSRQAMS